MLTLIQYSQLVKHLWQWFHRSVNSNLFHRVIYVTSRHYKLEMSVVLTVIRCHDDKWTSCKLHRVTTMSSPEVVTSVQTEATGSLNVCVCLSIPAGLCTSAFWRSAVICCRNHVWRRVCSEEWQTRKHRVYSCFCLLYISSYCHRSLPMRIYCPQCSLSPQETRMLLHSNQPPQQSKRRLQHFAMRLTKEHWLRETR